MFDSIRPVNAASNNASRARKATARALEPRMLFDAAAVETAIAVADQAVAAAPAPMIDASALFTVPPAVHHEAYVIDKSVQGYEALLSQVPAGSEVFLIDASQSGLAQLNTALASSGTSFDAIHLISHGTGGTLKLGSDIITLATLDSYQSGLQALGSHLTADGDLLLYGCDIAGTADGANLLSRLASITGAEVAASTDATGGPNGDADLEAWAGTGTLDAHAWSAVSLLQAPLQLDGVSAGNEDGDTGQADKLGWALDGSGEWVVAGGNGTGELQVWRVVGSTRTQQTLSLPAGANAATFGQAVSMDGNTFVVGDSGAGTAGKIFIYRLNTTTNVWAYAQTLDVNALTGAAADSKIGGWANTSYGSNQWLAISGSHIAVGAPNEGGGTGRIVWFADQSAGLDWSDLSAGGLGRGLIDEPGGYNDDSSPRFGASVSIAQDVLLVGAPGADLNGDEGAYGAGNTGNHGAIFVYSWSAGAGGAPTISTTVLKGNGDTGGIAQNAYFGAAIDIEYFKDPYAGGAVYKYTIAGGAPGEDGNKGELYVYQTTGSSISTINMSPSNIYGQTTVGGADNYGLAVTVSQSRIVIGAPNHNANTDAAVFYYESPSNTWTGMNTNNPAGAGLKFISWTEASYGGSGTDRFGISLAFTGGNNVAAGAPLFQTDDRGRVAFYYARTPVAAADNFSLNENSATTSFNPLANDIFGTENSTTVPVTFSTDLASVKGSLAWNAGTRTFDYNPNGEFEYLSVGQSETVSFNYRLTAQLGGVTFITEAKVIITINGQNDAPVTDAGIPNITVPRTNEPNQTPAGPSSVSIGNVAIPANAFFDVDQNDTLTYSLVSVVAVGAAPVAPGGFITVSGSYSNVTGTNTGNIAYNLTGMTANTSYNITVRANDGQGGTKDITFVFNVARDNENPATTGVTTQNATEDVTFSQSLAGFFSDPDTTGGLYPEKLTYTITAQSGPGADWLSISASGNLAGAASNDNVGTHSVTVRATDIFGNYITSTFNVVVANSNDAPVLVNAIDPKVSIKGETFSFNVKTGAVAWGGGGSPTTPVDNADPDYYFEDTDNYVGASHDNRTPSSADTVTYTAFNAVSGAQIIALGSGGNAAGANDVSWLAFNGTSFSGTSAGTLGSTVTIRLVATDNHGASTSTTFELGIFPRDGSATESTSLPTPSYAEQLGYDVAINSGSATGAVQGAAGRWAVVGEPGSDSGNGRIRIYENTNYATAGGTPSWTERYTFTTAAADARFGSAVDISADGLKIVVGAPNENNLQGAVYYFSNNGSGVWAANGTAKGVSPDANNGDRFGSAVAINEDGSSVLVGSPFDDEAGTNAGAAYKFAWGAATGAGKLMPTFDTGESVNTQRAGDAFGISVAFDKNMLVIGASRDDHDGKQDAGSVYVYAASNTTQFTKLTKGAALSQNQDYFGTSVDVDAFNGAALNQNSVVVVVGTPGDDTRAVNAGAVYVFRSDTMVADIADANGTLGSLTQQARVTAYNGQTLDGFGTTVAVDAYEVGGTDNASDVVRMAVGGSLNGASSGAVYAYRFWSGFNWVGQRYLPATTAIKFGAAVDIANTSIIVGAPDTTRTGGVSAPDTGTTQTKAGKFYSFGLAAGATIEIMPTSGAITKVLGSDEPSPVILANGNNGHAVNPPQPFAFLSSSVVDGNDNDLDDDWARLLRPVSSWALEAPALHLATQADAVPFSQNASYAEALLFDQRTLVNDVVVNGVVADAEIVQAKADKTHVPESKGSKDQPLLPAGQQELKPSGKSDADSPTEEAVLQDGVTNSLHGFSSQLQLVQGAKSHAAQSLLASLATLTSLAS